jgi:alkylhydroperoxidase/carboxymuconolactone decarboxylase family protein YurZ
MTSEQNKAVRSVLTTVAWALKVGVTKEQIIKAIQDLAGGAPAKAARGIWPPSDRQGKERGG